MKRVYGKPIKTRTIGQNNKKKSTSHRTYHLSERFETLRQVNDIKTYNNKRHMTITTNKYVKNYRKYIIL